MAKMQKQWHHQLLAEKLDHSYIAGENKKWYSHPGKQFDSFL